MKSKRSYKCGQAVGQAAFLHNREFALPNPASEKGYNRPSVASIPGLTNRW